MLTTDGAIVDGAIVDGAIADGANMTPDAVGGQPQAARDSSRADVAQSRIVSQLLPQPERGRLDRAARDGRLVRVGAVDLLRPERLPQLARLCLWLFLAAGAAFVVLDLAARQARHVGPLLGTGPLPLRLLVLMVANVAAYAVMIALHEALHAAAILTLGGAPRFGLKLPFAAYCTAPGQLFTPAGYTGIALAPLVVLTLAGILVTWFWPDVGALLWLAIVGNVSGAAGDLEAVAHLRRMPTAALIADTATGFVAYAAPVANAAG
jgi:hypothetical protein